MPVASVCAVSSRGHRTSGAPKPERRASSRKRTSSASEIGEVVKPRLRSSVLPDEPDNRILEAAVAGRAAALVTGDKAHLALGAYREIPILTLARYLD